MVTEDDKYMIRKIRSLFGVLDGYSALNFVAIGEKSKEDLYGADLHTESNKGGHFSGSCGNHCYTQSIWHRISQGLGRIVYNC